MTIDVLFNAFLVSAVIGIVCEINAYVLKLWVYKKTIYPITNILIMFALVMGGISLLIPSAGITLIFIGATLIGYAYEKINFSHLKWWNFPNDKFLFFKGKEACAISVAFMWGSVPIMSYFIQNAVQ